MKRSIRWIIAAAALTAYLAGLLFAAPPEEPYFILGIGMVALVSGLLGALPGLVTMAALIPLTHLIYDQFPIATSYEHFAHSPAFLLLQIALALGIGRTRSRILTMKETEAELQETNDRLQAALAHVKELGGVHSMCSGCKKIQDDSGSWQSIDQYLKEKTKMEFSHCICPDCAEAFKSASQSTSS